MTHIARSLVPFVPAILVLAGCAAPPPACPPCAAPPRAPAAKLERAPLEALPGWSGAALAPGLRAFASGCARLDAGSALRRACDAARALPEGDEAAARAFIESTFDAWSVAAADGSAEGTITGYYEPVLAGSRTRSDRFRIPVYGVPADLVAVDLDALYPELKGLRLRGRVEGNRLVPYLTRAEIEGGSGGASPFQAAVIAWVEDPVELFFLQIQGSGQIALETGERLRLGYADQNGHPYRSIGRYLVERHEMTLDQTSMQGIKAWAAANPGKLRDALDSNPSYVFFRELSAGSEDRGPIGTLGVPLAAGYSLAVDPRTVPLGAPLYLATTFPLSARPLERLMAAQDTGGAIRGAVRADFYWGSGAEAGTLAGRMRQRGRLWILWPRDEGPPR
ncbi:MAG TPA: MltA domain-containing protein [Burkholderiales bacterium]|nr:MltA domain-containing protein [Burkholderiales bacterium]